MASRLPARQGRPLLAPMLGQAAGRWQLENHQTVTRRHAAGSVAPTPATQGARLSRAMGSRSDELDTVPAYRAVEGEVTPLRGRDRTESAEALPRRSGKAKLLKEHVISGSFGSSGHLSRSPVPELSQHLTYLSTEP